MSLKSSLVRAAAGLCIAGLLPALAHAACSSPTGSEGSMRYDSSTKLMYFCNGTSWVSMGGGGGGTFSMIEAVLTPSGSTCTAVSTYYTCYSSYVSCPSGYSLVYYAMSGDNSYTSEAYDYMECQISGNTLRVYKLIDLLNVNFGGKCRGLCQQD